MEKIGSCPFCGRTPDVRGRKKIRVECVCGAKSAVMPVKSKAIEAWNKMIGYKEEDER